MRRLAFPIVVAAVILAVSFAGWTWWRGRVAPGGGGAAGVSQPEPPVEPHARPVEPRLVHGTVMVNDVPAATVGRGTPVYVCLILDPLPDTTVAAAPAEARLLVSDAVGRPVSVEWAMAPVTAPALEPGRSMLLAWTAVSAFEPGQYRIALVEPPAWLGLQAAGATGVRVATASLTVTTAPDARRVVAHHERRVLALQGRLAEWLTRIETDLKADPSDHAVASEYVDALDQAGRTAEALTALRVLASDMQKIQERVRPGIATELPDWVVFKLAELEARNSARSR